MHPAKKTARLNLAKWFTTPIMQGYPGLQLAISGLKPASTSLGGGKGRGLLLKTVALPLDDSTKFQE